MVLLPAAFLALAFCASVAAAMPLSTKSVIISDNFEVIFTFSAGIIIDIVPPSLMIAVAGIETNWGQSRFVKEGNALYREILWNNQSGMLPSDEKEDKSYSIKKFPDLISSMRSFALKLNSNVSYQSMRDFRAQMRRRKKTIDGASLASSLVLYSPEKNFIGLLDYTITFYELINVDAAKLIYNLPLSKPARTEIVIKS